jgi:hypothetical protein
MSMATIDVCCSYETWTYEAAEAGETDDRGFLWQNYPYTFRELVGLMREFTEPSDYPVQPGNGRVSFSTNDEEDFRTGERTRQSIHLSNPDEPRAIRYWLKAYRTAEKHRLAYLGASPAS